MHIFAVWLQKFSLYEGVFSFYGFWGLGGHLIVILAIVVGERSKFGCQKFHEIPVFCAHSCERYVFVGLSQMTKS